MCAYLPPPCFVPSDANFRISLRDRTFALRTDKSAPSPGGSSSANTKVVSRTVSNPGALITTVGGVHASRIALYVNSIAALQVRTVQHGKVSGGVVVGNPRAKVHEQWV